MATVVEKAWKKRNWRQWLEQHLAFPFTTEREDADGAELFGSEKDADLFLVGQILEVSRLDEEEGRWGIQAVARHGGRTGSVPLADLSVRPKQHPNCKIVLEYSVAVANDYVDLE